MDILINPRKSKHNNNNNNHWGNITENIDIFTEEEEQKKRWKLKVESSFISQQLEEGHPIFILMDRSDVNNQVNNTSAAQQNNQNKMGSEMVPHQSNYQDYYSNAKPFALFVPVA